MRFDPHPDFDTVRRWPLYLLVILTALLPTTVSAHGGGGGGAFSFELTR